MIRPAPNRNLDQFRATDETVTKRAALLSAKGDLVGKRLFFLGDADLTSVSVARLHQIIEIVVVDVDKKVLEYIKYLSQKEKLKIITIYYDAKESEFRYQRRFDIAFIDPPYTPMGLKIFLSRVINVLKPDGIIYLCYGYTQREPERGLVVQEILSQAGLLIEEKIPDFNHYIGAASIGNKSSLYICRLTPKTKVPFVGQFKGPIYTGKRGKRGN